MMEAQTILVVDDLDIVRSLCKVALESAGYKVIVAEDGISALESYRIHAETISLVLVDVWMPGVDGIHVARRIRASDSKLPVILMSGDNTRSVVPPDLGTSCAVLDKPFTIGTLRNAVEAGLASPERVGGLTTFAGPPRTMYRAPLQ